MHGAEAFQTTHDYNTRGCDNAHPIFQRLTQTQKSVSFAGPNVWNTLPISIRNSNSLEVFKKQLKKYYLSNYSDNNELL